MSKLDLHLAALAAVSATLGVAAQKSEAAVVYSGIVNLNIPSTTNGLYLNVVTGANNLPASGPGSGVAGWDINPWSSGGFGLFNPATGNAYVNATTGGTQALNLPLGSQVGPAQLYGSSTSAASPQWNLSSSNNYFGFRFFREGDVAGTFHYGWANFSLSGTLGAQPRTLIDYAYDNTVGTAINVGDGRPTPGATSLLAIGAAGLISRRRK